MNIIVDSNDKILANFIASSLANVFNITSVRYDYDQGEAGKVSVRPGVKNYIITPGPDTTKKYRQLSSSGFSPDLVIVITTSDDGRVDQFNTFYEGRVAVFPHTGIERLLDNIVKAVYDEFHC